VVWTSYRGGSNTDIFGQRYGSSGAPIGQEFRINTYTTSIQGAPAAAADAFGEFIVIWSSFDQDGSEYGVFGQRFGNSGAPVGPEFRVNTYTSGRQFQPAVADDVLGSFVVVWTSAGQDYAVFGQRYSALGAVLGPEFRVSGYARIGEVPAVAADPSGNFIITWGGYDGYQGGVFGQRYATSGPSMGPEFRVNTYTTGHQSNPAVGADPMGKFVIAWDSESQDGSSYGIFGQRYGQIVPVELIGLGVE
jgi:hypothetical protein